MTSAIAKTYAKLRANPVSCLVGRDAEMALRDARIICAFRDAESADLVRIGSDSEDENYFHVFGRSDDERENKAIAESIERNGCVYVYTEWFDGAEWHRADGIGMCIYGQPESPFENCYVSELMRSALDALENHNTAQHQDLCLAMGEAELS